MPGGTSTAKGSRMAEAPKHARDMTREEYRAARAEVVQGERRSRLASLHTSALDAARARHPDLARAADAEAARLAALDD